MRGAILTGWLRGRRGRVLALHDLGLDEGQALQPGFVLITDAAHGRWLATETVDSCNGFARYVEREVDNPGDCVPFGSPRPRSAEKAKEHWKPRQLLERLPGTGKEDATELERLIIERLPRRVRDSVHGGLAFWCRDSADAPANLDSVWQTLGRVRVVDFRCGSGDRLLRLASSLEGWILACLDRAISGQVDSWAGSETARPVRWLEALLQPLGGRPIDDPRIEQKIRSRVVAEQLFGWDGDPAARRVCRRRLSRFSGMVAPAAGLLVNVRSGPETRRDDAHVIRFGGNADHAADSAVEGSIQEYAMEEDRVLQLAREAAISERSHCEGKLPPTSVSFPALWEQRRGALIRRMRATTRGRHSAAVGETSFERVGLWSMDDIVFVCRNDR